PYSGDTARMLISVAHRDGTFAVQGHGLCIVECADSPAAVASLEITHGASAVANGGAFRFQVELRDTGGMPVSAGAGVSVELLSGSGTLGGTTFRVATSGVAVFDDLVVTGASNSLRLRFSVV